jgi:SAM-dependent methyltransferase
MTDSDFQARRVRHVREIADAYLARGDAVGWFEEFYREQQGDASRVPWADPIGHPLLSAWLAERGPPPAGARSAVVVGCGLGEECEHVAEAGWDTLGFDVSPTAVDWCRRRFPGSRVRFEVADLFALPKDWRGTFDLVVEVYTLQALPADVRPDAARRIAELVAPGGTLLVITRGREPDEPAEALPWPLVRGELDVLTEAGLELRRFDDVPSLKHSSGRRFRVEYRAPSA